MMDRADTLMITLAVVVGCIGGLVLIGLLSMHGAWCQVEPGGIVCF